MFVATEARAAGHVGIVAVSRATGIARSTIGRGLRELDEAEPLEPGWVRREGGGRKTLVVSNPGLLGALLALVRPTERGDPMSPLRWTCLSLRQLDHPPLRWTRVTAYAAAASCSLLAGVM